MEPSQDELERISPSVRSSFSWKPCLATLREHRHNCHGLAMQAGSAWHYQARYPGPARQSILSVGRWIAPLRSQWRGERAFSSKVPIRGRLLLSRPALYDTYHLNHVDQGTRHDRPDRRDRRPAPRRGVLDRPADRRSGRPCRDRHARHQHPAAVAAADGGVAERHQRGGHLGHHHLSCRIRGRPARGRADLGPLRPPLAGADRIRRVLRRQHLVRARDRPDRAS